MKWISFGVALAFSAASFAALAAQGAGAATSPPSAMPSFEQADKDGSGSIETSEMTGIAGLDVSAADTDRDGKLSRSEYEAARESHEAGRDGDKPSPGGAPR